MALSPIKNVATGLFLGSKVTPESGPEWVVDVSDAWKPKSLTASMIARFCLAKDGFNIETIAVINENQLNRKILEKIMHVINKNRSIGVTSINCQDWSRRGDDVLGDIRNAMEMFDVRLRTTRVIAADFSCNLLRFIKDNEELKEEPPNFVRFQNDFSNRRKHQKL